MLAKLNVPANSDVEPMVAMIGAARGGSKKGWESDSGAIFYMFHTRAGMTKYKKASPGTTVEVANGNILPVNGFGTIEVDQDQLGNTAKLGLFSATGVRRIPRQVVALGASIAKVVSTRTCAGAALESAVKA